MPSSQSVPSSPRAARIAAVRTPSALRAVYRRLAPWYDRLVPLVSRRARAVGHDWLAVRDGERVLDVGTGTGLSLSPLVAANPHGWTVGVDLTPAMLHRARARLAEASPGRFTLEQASARALPYAADTFDAVYSSYLVDVLARSHRRPALAEMHRILRPGGRLVLVHPAPPTGPIERLWARLMRGMPRLFGGARPVDVRPALRQVGFSVRRTTAHSQLGFRSAIVLARPE